MFLWNVVFLQPTQLYTPGDKSLLNLTQFLVIGLVSIIEELFEKKSSGSVLENRDYGRTDPSRWPRGTLYPQKLAITSPTSGGRSVGVVRSLTQTMEVFFFGMFKKNKVRHAYHSVCL
jgi:hypothetical protein